MPAGRFKGGMGADKGVDMAPADESGEYIGPRRISSSAKRHALSDLPVVLPSGNNSMRPFMGLLLKDTYLLGVGCLPGVAEC